MVQFQCGSRRHSSTATSVRGADACCYSVLVSLSLVFGDIVVPGDTSCQPLSIHKPQPCTQPITALVPHIYQRTPVLIPTGPFDNTPGIYVGGYVVPGYPMKDEKSPLNGTSTEHQPVTLAQWVCPQLCLTLLPTGRPQCMVSCNQSASIFSAVVSTDIYDPILVGPLVLPLYLLLVWIAAQLTLHLFVGLLGGPCYPSGTGWEASNSAILLVLLFVGP